MQHLEIAKRDSRRKDIEQRLAGRFYTPESICVMLAQQVLATCHAPKSVMDPFCGDGRLVVAWLRAASYSAGSLARLRSVYLWDCDAEAVKMAQNAVRAELRSLGLCGAVQVLSSCGDTFGMPDLDVLNVSVVLTNPPWELLKPDTRDAISEGSEYRDTLRSYAGRLAATFPEAHSMRRKAMTGYGLNLARAGALASLRMLAGEGAMGIVLPASIFADQASEPFRAHFFRHLAAKQINFYPAEARLFTGVDQAFVTLVGIKGCATDVVRLSRMEDASTVSDSRLVEVGNRPEKPIALGIGGAEEVVVAKLALAHPQLENLEHDLRFGLWLGRELDETRFAEALTDSPRGVPFLKGRDIQRYGLVSQTLARIDPSKRKIPSTVGKRRIAWRDVSRASQMRRVQAALVPNEAVTGNSLGVGLFQTGPDELLPALLSVLNSIVFEVQVRARLATVHISQGVLRKCVVPWAAFEDASLRMRLASLVSARLLDPALEPMLEVAVARAYGLRRDDFADLLLGFSKITCNERDALLYAELWQ